MRVLPLVILGTVFLFLAGLIAPRRSKRIERWMDERLREGRRKSARRAGRLGDWAATSLRYGQRIGDAAVQAGRRVRRWLPLPR